MSGTALPAPDDLLTALGTVRRRRVLHLLMTRGTLPAAPDEVVAAAPESGDPTAYGGRPIALPKLEECGYVEWDPTARVFRRGPNFDEVERLLEL